MASPAPAHAASARRTLWIIAATVVAAAVGIAGALAYVDSRPDAVGTAAPNSPTASATAGGPTAPNGSDLPVVAPPVKTVPTVTFSLVAVGDVLPHQPVLDSAKVSGGGYNFVPLMKPTEPFIKGADIALCHMEVPVAPDGTKPSGYPQFGAPAKLVTDLATLGWDGCSTASNHTVDRGFAGIESTLNAFQAEGMGHAGSARSEHEAAQTQFYNVVEQGRTIKVAHISYAYGLNGLPVPAGKPWSVNVFNASGADVTPILAAAKAAREAGADIVVSSVHCCVEYTTQPTSTQASIVQQIADSGLVDLYIGHHAHVPQPIARLDGGPGGDGMWAAYGLGNFISNQAQENVGVAETSSGELLTATFTVSPDHKVAVDVGWTAVTVDRLGGHKVFPINENSGAVGTLSAGTVKARWQLVADAVGSAAPEITSPGTPGADFVWRNTRSR